MTEKNKTKLLDLIDSNANESTDEINLELDLVFTKIPIKLKHMDFIEDEQGPAIQCDIEYPEEYSEIYRENNPKIIEMVQEFINEAICNTIKDLEDQE